MKIKLYSVAIAIAAIVVASETACADEQSDLNNMLGSLSHLLSSTNPKLTNAEPGAGDATDAYSQQPDNTRQRIATLPPLVPPLHSGASQTVQANSQDAEAPPVKTARIIQPQVDYENLSPETKRILESTPRGIGNQPTGSRESIVMKRGDFDQEYGTLIDGPIDKGEKPEDAFKPGKFRKAANGQIEAEAAMPETKPKFDIKVQKGRKGDALLDDLDKALRSLNAGQYEVSIAIYKSVLQKDSRNRDAMFGLAAAYQKAGQRIQARDAYAKLLSAYPGFQPGLNNLLVLASNEAPNDALRELDVIGKRDPNFAPVYAQKASIYAQIGDIANAKKNFIKALNIEPDNVVYRYNLAVLLDKNGDTITAAKLYNQILDQNTQGARLPVDRSQIEERLAFIGSQHSSRT